MLTLKPASAAAQDPGGAYFGKWAVNRARTRGLTFGREPSVGDVEWLLLWMRAASRIAPGLPDPYLAEHDLLLLTDRSDEAFEALKRYCDHNPSDHSMRLGLLIGQFERIQTAEDRVEFCRNHLRKKKLPPSIVSELHRLLGETHFGAGDWDAARQAAEQAVQAYRFNFAAHQLRLRLSDGAPSPVHRAEYLLALISASPTDWRAMHSLALLLDSVGAHDEALPWHTRAVDLARQGSRVVPLELLVGRVRSASAAGQEEQAKTWVARAVAVHPAWFELAMLQLELANGTGDEALASDARSRIKKRLATVEAHPLGEVSARDAAQIAWFYIKGESSPEKALRYAEAAHGLAPNDADIRRIYGLALVKNERWRDAQDVLGPLGTADAPDPLAAWGLARALHGLDRDDLALQVLRDAERAGRSGQAHERIVALLGEMGQEPLPITVPEDVVQLVAGFDDAALTLPNRLDDVLTLTIRPAVSPQMVGHPWECVFELRNTGSSPITLGKGQMVEGDVLLSADPQVGNEPPRPGFLVFPIAMRPALEPGESVEVLRSIDVGALADLTDSRPQRRLAISLTAILDPVAAGDGGWRSRLGEGVTSETRLDREPVQYTKAGIDNLLRLLQSHDPRRRIEGLRAVAALLGERLDGMAGKLDYEPPRVDKSGLERWLLAGLEDPTPYVRAAALDCLEPMTFNATVIGHVAPLLSDEHWLVRFAAVDFLAERQGVSFAKVLQRLAGADRDSLVRDLARLHLQRLGETQSSGERPPQNTLP